MTARLPPRPKRHSPRDAAPARARRLRKGWSVAPLLALACAGCSIVQGNGEQESKSFEIPSVSRLEVCCGFEVSLTQDPNAEPSLLVRTDENLLNEVAVHAAGDQLAIGWRDGATVYRPTDSVHVDIVLPRLDHFEGSGGMSLKAGDLESPTLRVELSGGSQADLGKVTVDDFSLAESGGSEVVLELLVTDALELSSSGGSTLTAQGTAPRISAEISGGGSLDAPDLLCEQIDLNLSGGSLVTVTATQELNGSASGGSQVWVSGDPKIDVSLSGGSEVHEN